MYITLKFVGVFGLQRVFVRNNAETGNRGKQSAYTLTSIQFLRRLCNHPVRLAIDFLIFSWFFIGSSLLFIAFSTVS